MCSRLIRRIWMCACALVLAAEPLSAQYFGRNKVQFKKHHFQVLTTDHFDIYYYPAEKPGVDIAARLAERWHARLQRLLDHQLTGRQPLILYASHVDFEQTNAIQGEIGEGTGGVTEPLRRRIILPLAGPLADTDHVIGHELVHAFQFDIGSERRQSAGGNGIERLPLWFVEGMAEYLSIGADDPNTSMWLRDAARRDKLPSIGDLGNPRYFPYRWGQAFWAYIGGRYGDGVIARILKAGATSGNAETALEAVLQVKIDELTAGWHQAIRERYATLLAASTPPHEIGTLVIGGKDAAGSTNIGPSLSPDGKRIAFLSERSLLSIDLFVADIDGKNVHRLTSTASDPHFSSLQFIASAGAWDSHSERLAIGAITNGRPALAIFDADRGERIREIPIADVDEVFSPAWSPDNRAIAFTAMTRGLTDLFVVDVESGAVRALTNDAYAELQPVWSPDGSRIAYATDRFTSTLESLAIGRWSLATIAPSGGSPAPVGGFVSGKSINPQWSADGSTLYFVSDQNGVPNLARVAAAGGTPTLLTNLSTGISGITATSPTLSIAADAGIAAVSVYDEGRYDIYTRALDLPAAQRPITDAGRLPPVERRQSDVAAVLTNAQAGLPPVDVNYPTSGYKARFGLEALGQPSIGVGTSQFGTFVGGGLSAYFSDILGNRTLGASVSLNSGLNGSVSAKDTAAQASYIDLSRRWYWGILGGQVPYLSGGYQEALTTVDGIPSYLAQTVVFRQTERSAAGVVAYPLSRQQRVEFQAGATQLSFDQTVRTQAFALDTGELLLDETDTKSLGSNITLGNTAAALVYDTTVFGATSPVTGQRYRFEAAPTIGTISYASLLVDYRRYLMPVPFVTIAARATHYGRYGSGGEDPRLTPLYLGYPTLVRGYDVNSFDASDCVSDATTSCALIDRLVGSRMLVGNLELRFPLLRPFRGASSGMYGPVPVEVALFADGGLTWNRGQRPFDRRDGVSSAGVALRANLLGFAIGEFAFSHPFQRPGHGFVFQFNLTPGF